MKQRVRSRHTIDFLFTVGLFAMFAISSLTVIIAGAGVYKNTTAVAEAAYDTFTPLAYLEQKVRAHDYAGGISVETHEDISVLCLHQTINDSRYTTFIFVKDGYLKELFVRDDDSPDTSMDSGGPDTSMGEKLMPAEALTIHADDDHTLRFRIHSPSGDLQTLRLTIYSEDGISAA